MRSTCFCHGCHAPKIISLPSTPSRPPPLHLPRQTIQDLMRAAVSVRRRESWWGREGRVWERDKGATKKKRKKKGGEEEEEGGWKRAEQMVKGLVDARLSFVNIRSFPC